MRESENNEIAEKLISKLIAEREFQRLWHEATLEMVTHRENQRSSGADNNDGNDIPQPPVDSVTAGQVVDELSSVLNLTVDNFLRSITLALPNSEDKLARETASLYSVRVQLNRLVHHTQLHLPQLRLASRRISYLLRSFTTCTSSHFPVPSCSYLASSLCDLLYQFEELCSVNPDLVPAVAAVRLKRAIDDFHYDVVKRLNAIMLQRRPATAATTTTSGLGTSFISTSNLSPSPNRSGNRVALAPTIIFRRTPSKHPSQKGYILSPELEEARSRLRRSRSLLPNNQTVNKKLEIEEIENRWKSMLSKDPNKLLKAVAGREGSDSQAALKAACKLTRSVVDEIARHVERL